MGCASTPKGEDVIAVVEGDPVTVNDLEYSLEIAHRREDLSSAKTLDIAHYIDKLINERLLIHEAARMGMQDYPGIRRKLRDYLIRESVVRLYNEEITQKVTVQEEEIASFYRENYDTFTFDMLELGSQEDAADLLEQLKSGERFEELAAEHPSAIPGRGEKGYTFTRMSLNKDVRDPISGLQPGEFTDVIKVRDKYLIIKLLGREDAPETGLAEAKTDIRDTIGKLKVKEREKSYLNELREKTSIEIDDEILSSITFGESRDDQRRWMHDERPLVKINDTVLTVGDFAAMLKSTEMETKKRVMNSWIERKVIDQEALSRKYDETVLKNHLRRYRNQLLQKEFAGRVIAPGVRISEEDLKSYYTENLRGYLIPTRYKIRQITLKTREEAEAVLNSLQKGADFFWMIKMKSDDKTSSPGKTLQWKTKDTLKKSVREIIDSLMPGEISNILEDDSAFTIVRLQEKSKEEFEEFEKVVSSIHKKVFYRKYRKLYDEYIEKLKKDAKITLNDRTIGVFKEIFNK